MPIIIKTLVGVLVSTLGKMVMKYLAQADVIEDLVMYGLEALAKHTDSKVDDEVLKIIKEKIDAE